MYRHFGSDLPDRDGIRAFLAQLYAGNTTLPDSAAASQNKVQAPQSASSHLVPQENTPTPVPASATPLPASSRPETSRQGASGDEASARAAVAPLGATMPRSAGKSRSAFSISNMLAQGQQSHQQTQGKAVQPQVCEPVAQQDLEKIWARLCENAAKEKRIGLHTAMNAADVRMEGESVIGITVSSTTAEHELEEHMLELLERIRTALRNTSLTHRITVNESVRERLPYTPREKYEYLRKKNPLIENMRAELDLNIDF